MYDRQYLQDSEAVGCNMKEEEEMKGRTIAQIRAEAFVQWFYGYMMDLRKRGKKE